MKSKLTLALSLLLLISGSPVGAADTQALDINAFRRDLDRHHELSAKGDPRLRRELKTLERLTRRVTDLPGLWAALATVEGKLGNTARAEDDFQKALSRSGAWVGAAVLKADYLRKQGKPEDAETLLTSAKTLYPDEPCLDRRLAECAFVRNPAKSAQLWEKIHRNSLYAADALLASARADFAANDLESSRTKLKKLDNDHPLCREVLEWRKRTNLDPRESASIREFIASKGRDCDDLTGWIEGLVARHPDQTLALYTQAVTRYSNCAVLWRRYGQAREEAGQNQEALRAYRIACSLTGASDPFLSSRIKELGGMNECAVGTTPKTERPVWKGTAAKTLQDLKGRKVISEKDMPLDLLLRVAKDPSVGPELRKYLETKKANALMVCALVESASWKAEKKWAQATETLQLASEARALDPRPFATWCDLLRIQNDLPAALALCDQWEKVTLGTGPHFTRAVLFADQKEYKKALVLLDEVLSREPAHSDAWRVKVDCLAALGMRAEAGDACEMWAQWKPLDRRAYVAWKSRVEPGSEIDKTLAVVLKTLQEHKPAN